jgi:hypothetical protein
MNERIRELAKQAGFIEEDGGDNLHVFDGYEAITCTEELSKFAELLIRECNSKLDNIGVIDRDSRTIAMKVISEHFGVE